ncbi:zinc ribbon domain-containing protein, partial [Parathermosynechococcus lividus]
AAFPCNIDRWFPASKRCGNCGHIVERLLLDIREWDCPTCAAHHDRDINAAINSLAVGHTVSTCRAIALAARSANVRPNPFRVAAVAMTHGMGHT